MLFPPKARASGRRLYSFSHPLPLPSSPLLSSPQRSKRSRHGFNSPSLQILAINNFLSRTQNFVMILDSNGKLFKDDSNPPVRSRCGPSIWASYRIFIRRRRSWNGYFKPFSYYTRLFLPGYANYLLRQIRNSE